MNNFIWDSIQADMMMMMMASQKRSEDVLLVDGGGNGGLSSKRLKGSCGRRPVSIREKKDKIGERVAALQQLVSPFGKTDTASVLQEATGYIKFLHEQIQVLSAPYLQKPPPTLNSQSLQDQHSLRSKGLCLVPMAYSLQLANSNGADIWAPINTRKS